MGRGIKGFLSRQYDGTYIFSRWEPERKLLGSRVVFHQREVRGQIDPWWFGLSKNMCEASLLYQGIELEILESRPFIWSMESMDECPKECGKRNKIIVGGIRLERPDGVKYTNAAPVVEYGGLTDDDVNYFWKEWEADEELKADYAAFMDLASSRLIQWGAKRNEQV